MNETPADYRGFLIKNIQTNKKITLYLFFITFIENLFMRLAICYVSNSNLNLARKDIEKLLAVTQAKYESRNIRGIFLYSERNIFQIIEGETENVLKLWKEKQEDKRHSNLIKIFEEEISTPAFDGYLCEYISEEDEYNPEKTERLFDKLKYLDEKPKNTAEEILKLFLKYQ